MKRTTTIIRLLMLSTIIYFVSQCNNPTSKETQRAVIIPVPLPKVVPGFSFPEDSNQVYAWLSPYDSTHVYQHAWGIWAGLTANSGQSYQGDSLLVYQTWLGLGEIQSLVEKGAALTQGQELTKTSLTPLTIPRQLQHAAFFKALRLGQTIDTSAGSDFGTNFWVAVSYNNPAVKHVLKHELLKQSVLDSYLKKDAIGVIPPFPNDAITIKPTYYVGHATDSLIRIPAWMGTPSPARAYDPSVWHSYIYADVKNRQPAGKHLVIDTSANPTPEQIAAATCNVSDFISIKMDAAMAHYFNKEQSGVQGDTAKAGDLALLVAMHVTSKEISNWTWQTFYWAPNPETPQDPSSALAAMLRPGQLSNAAAHYALSTAYVEVLPNQPIMGGTNTGVSTMIGYNPYLEATFDPSTFGFKNRLSPALTFGCQTNCMSCHAMANVQNPNLYSTDQYISMNDSVFINKVQLDFAWSIQSAIIQDLKK